MKCIPQQVAFSAVSHSWISYLPKGCTRSAVLPLGELSNSANERTARGVVCFKISQEGNNSLRSLIHKVSTIFYLLLKIILLHLKLSSCSLQFSCARIPEPNFIKFLRWESYLFIILGDANFKVLVFKIVSDVKVLHIPSIKCTKTIRSSWVKCYIRSTSQCLLL